MQNSNNNNNYIGTNQISYATVVPLPCPSAPVALVAPDTNSTKKQRIEYDETKKQLTNNGKIKKRRNKNDKIKKKRILNDASNDLRAQGFTDGLIQSIYGNTDVFPLRIWVIDNSGSMNSPDGHRLHQCIDNKIKLLDCTRWAEIQNTVNYHARMAALLEAPTSFRFLNPTYRNNEFGIAVNGPEYIQEDLRVALSTIREVSPSGVTPLSDRVREIATTIVPMKESLIAKGQKVVVVLATDGLPSDQYGQSTHFHLQEFKNALHSLQGLPVWLVIRLCTDDDKVVEFYNNIDSQLEMSLDVLDDFLAEAKEVYEQNKWLNYALPLHRMREMGFYHKLFDLIDERPMQRDELPDFFRILYGADALDSLPDPQVDWARFLDRIVTVTNAQKLQWNPIKKKMTPWVDIRKLDREFRDTPGCFLW